MAATSSEAAPKARATPMLIDFAMIDQYCRRLDENQQERIKVVKGVVHSMIIFNQLMEYPEFRKEAAECHIPGAMQDPAEPPSAADTEPAVAPDAIPPLLTELAQEAPPVPEAPAAQEDVSGDWHLTDQFEKTPEAPPEHAEPTEFVDADANWDDWDAWDEAEQISEAQSSQPVDEHTRHNGEHSVHFWRHNTATKQLLIAEADESMPRRRIQKR